MDATPTTNLPASWSTFFISNVGLEDKEASKYARLLTSNDFPDLKQHQVGTHGYRDALVLLASDSSLLSEIGITSIGHRARIAIAAQRVLATLNGSDQQNMVQHYGSFGLGQLAGANSASSINTTTSAVNSKPQPSPARAPTPPPTNNSSAGRPPTPSSAHTPTSNPITTTTSTTPPIPLAPPTPTAMAIALSAPLVMPKEPPRVAKMPRVLTNSQTDGVHVCIRIGTVSTPQSGAAPSAAPTSATTSSTRRQRPLTWIDVCGRDASRSSFDGVLNVLAKRYRIAEGLIDAIKSGYELPQVLTSPDKKSKQLLIILRVATSSRTSIEEDALHMLTNRWMVLVNLEVNVVISIHRVDTEGMATLRTSWGATSYSTSLVVQQQMHIAQQQLQQQQQPPIGSPTSNLQIPFNSSPALGNSNGSAAYGSIYGSTVGGPSSPVFTSGGGGGGGSPQATSSHYNYFIGSAASAYRSAPYLFPPSAPKGMADTGSQRAGGGSNPGSLMPSRASNARGSSNNRRGGGSLFPVSSAAVGSDHANHTVGASWSALARELRRVGCFDPDSFNDNDGHFGDSNVTTDLPFMAFDSEVAHQRRAAKQQSQSVYVSGGKKGSTVEAINLWNSNTSAFREGATTTGKAPATTSPNSASPSTAQALFSADTPEEATNCHNSGVDDSMTLNALLCRLFDESLVAYVDALHDSESLLDLYESVMLKHSVGGTNSTSTSFAANHSRNKHGGGFLSGLFGGNNHSSNNTRKKGGYKPVPADNRDSAWVDQQKSDGNKKGTDGFNSDDSADSDFNERRKSFRGDDHHEGRERKSGGDGNHNVDRIRRQMEAAAEDARQRRENRKLRRENRKLRAQAKEEKERRRQERQARRDQREREALANAHEDTNEGDNAAFDGAASTTSRGGNETKPLLSRHNFHSSQSARYFAESADDNDGTQNSTALLRSGGGGVPNKDSGKQFTATVSLYDEVDGGSKDDQHASTKKKSTKNKRATVALASTTNNFNRSTTSKEKKSKSSSNNNNGSFSARIFGGSKSADAVDEGDHHGKDGGYSTVSSDSSSNSSCSDSSFDSSSDGDDDENGNTIGYDVARMKESQYFMERALRYREVKEELFSKSSVSRERMNQLLYHLHRRCSVYQRMLTLMQSSLEQGYGATLVAFLNSAANTTDSTGPAQQADPSQPNHYLGASANPNAYTNPNSTPNVEYAEQLTRSCGELALKAEALHDNCQNLLNLHLSLVSFRTNELMAILTIFSAFFTPITFVVGVYGMNFSNMPEIQWEYGYYYCLALNASVCIAVFIFFRGKGLI